MRCLPSNSILCGQSTVSRFSHSPGVTVPFACDHSALVQDLEDLLGTNVHIGTEKSLHWFTRKRILEEAVPL